MGAFTRYWRMLPLAAVAAAVMAAWLPGCAKRLKQKPAFGASELIPYHVSSSERPRADRAPIVYDTLIDARDGKTYRTVKIGGRAWMAENLNYPPKTGSAKCYDDDDLNCDDYGRLYDREAAKDACPPKWHLPSRGEWDSLSVAVGGARSDGLSVWKGISRKLKARDGWKNYGVKSGNGYDHYGFSALPGGAVLGGEIPLATGVYGAWWTSTEAENGSAYIRFMTKYNGDVIETVDGDDLFSEEAEDDAEAVDSSALIRFMTQYSDVMEAVDGGDLFSKEAEDNAEAVDGKGIFSVRCVMDE